MPIAATLLVLAGGHSRRMRTAKALLPVGATTLIEWLVERLAADFDHLLVAAQDSGQLPAGLRRHLVADLHLGAGPMAGIEAGLAAARGEHVFALACDMPAATSELAGRLLALLPGHEAVVPVAAGRRQPTCAAYARSAAGPIAAQLAAGARRADDVLAGLDVLHPEEPPELFANLNTPADYRAFLGSLRQNEIIE